MADGTLPKRRQLGNNRLTGGNTRKKKVYPITFEEAYIRVYNNIYV